MARKKEAIISHISQEEIKKLLKEKMKEDKKKHTVWIDLKYGNTYIGYDTYDSITEKSMLRLTKLMELMDIEYSLVRPLLFGDDEAYYIIIEGEDNTRAEFIQRFFDNGCKLCW